MVTPGSGTAAGAPFAPPESKAESFVHLDDLGRSEQRRRSILVLLVLGTALVASVVVGVGLGPVFVPPDVVAQILVHHVSGGATTATWMDSQDTIVWTLRVPRVLLGVLVGASLAVSGVVLQAMVRNVLAEPYILGISYGASTGATLAILFGVGAGLGGASLSLTAFLGAMGASVLLFVVARSSGRITSARLLLSGVAVGYVLLAATNVLIFLSGRGEQTRAVLFWLLGSVALARWDFLLVLAPAVLIGLPLLVIAGRRLDALALGDATSLALGVRPDQFRALLLVVVSLLVGATVAVSGGIGFVGLVIPHVARRLVGSSHQRVLPVAALLGALFLVWADVAARLVLQPRELPLGVVTAIVGAPFLLLLVRRLHASST